MYLVDENDQSQSGEECVVVSITMAYSGDEDGGDDDDNEYSSSMSGDGGCIMSYLIYW